MACGSHSRERLFEVFSNNLNIFFSRNGYTLYEVSDEEKRIIDEDIYICPLCMNGFLRMTLDQSMPNPLTIEHVPPENSGGKLRVLLCKKCNSSKGHRDDHIISKILKSEHLSRGKPKIIGTGKITFFPGSNLSLRLEAKPDHGLIFHIDYDRNPVITSKLATFFAEKQNYQVKFTLQTPSKKRYADALLQCGYLLAFNYFGYSFLLEPNIGNIRNHIHNQKDYLLPHSSVVTGDNFSYFKEGIHMVTSPHELSCYAVMFTTRASSMTKQNIVFLPGPGKKAWESYLNLKKLNSSIQLSFVALTSKIDLKNPSWVNAYFDIYRNMNLFANE